MFCKECLAFEKALAETERLWRRERAWRIAAEAEKDHQAAMLVLERLAAESEPLSNFDYEGGRQ